MVTSGETAGTNGRRPDTLLLPRWVWATYAAGLALVAGVVASTNWLDAPNRVEEPVWPYIIDEATSVGLIFALTAVLASYVMKLDPRRIGWLRVIAGHLAGLVIFCAAHVGGMILLRMALYPLFGGYYAIGSNWLVDVVLYESRKDLLSYSGLVILMWLAAAALRRPVQTPVLPTAVAEPIRIQHREGGMTTWLPPSDILWVEAAGNYVELVLPTRTVLQRQTLNSMERRLAAAGFVRIHRSRLVNAEHIRSIVSRESGDYAVVLADGREVLGSRRFRSALDAVIQSQKSADGSSFSSADWQSAQGRN
jgi:hypothetical protein